MSTETETQGGAVAAGRVALVTGAARGIGLATAKELVAAGYRVAATHRHGPAEDGDGIFWVHCDVTDSTQIESAFEKVEAELGPVEVLVSNAGMTADGLILRMGDEAIDDVIATNLGGALRVARRASQKMVRARWGRMVFLGSVVGTAGQAGQANYAASKAGLVGVARSLAKELASRNITVNVVAPGPIATDMLAAVGDDRQAAMAEAVPLGRLGASEEVAATIRFLASDDAAYITGAVIPVDGGLSLGPW